MLLPRLFIQLQLRLRREISSRSARRPRRMAQRRNMISFTFDDFPASAVNVAGAQLHARGLRGTYYAAFGLMNSDWRTGRAFGETELHELAAQGHELGCHTFAHCHAWDTRPALFERSIVENGRALAQWLPGATFSSLSYPYSYPRPGIKRVASRHFACCRGGGPSFNAGEIDLNDLQAFFPEKTQTDFAPVRRIIEQNRLAGGWLIFAFHQIAENPNRFGVTPAFFADTVSCAIDSGALILPVSAALAQI